MVKKNYYNSNNRTYKIRTIINNEIQVHHFLISIVNNIHDNIKDYIKNNDNVNNL